MEINVYCDESCHLEKDRQPVMVLGAVWCPQDSVAQIGKDIRAIKERHGLPRSHEFKWTKISESKKDFYIDLVDCFFHTGNLNFRGYIAQKEGLNHALIPDQTHDTWYYKIYFRMLEQIFTRENTYNIYLDIKDTRGGRKTRKLHEVLCNSKLDFNEELVKRIQLVRSHEVELVQLADVLIGALSFIHCGHDQKPEASPAKLEVIERIRQKSGYNLTLQTPLREIKFNLFFWQPQARGA